MRGEKGTLLHRHQLLLHQSSVCHAHIHTEYTRTDAHYRSVSPTTRVYFCQRKRSIFSPRWQISECVCLCPHELPAGIEHHPLNNIFFPPIFSPELEEEEEEEENPPFYKSGGISIANECLLKSKSLSLIVRVVIFDRS